MAAYEWEEAQKKKELPGYQIPFQPTLLSVLVSFLYPFLLVLFTAKTLIIISFHLEELLEVCFAVDDSL